MCGCDAYNPSAERRGWGQVDSWDSLTIHSSLIGEPQVPVKDCVLKNKVGVREMAHQVQMLTGQTQQPASDPWNPSEDGK